MISRIVSNVLSALLLVTLAANPVQAGYHYFYNGNRGWEELDSKPSYWNCNGGASQADTYNQAVQVGGILCTAWAKYEVWDVSGWFGTKDWKYQCCGSKRRQLEYIEGGSDLDHIEGGDHLGNNKDRELELIHSEGIDFVGDNNADGY